MWTEHVNGSGRGSTPSAVTVAAELVRGRARLVITVGRGVLEHLPWYRGGQGVAVMLGSGAEAGRLRVVRGDTHRLLAVVQGGAAGRLEKLPPVVLRMDPTPGMRPGAEHPPEAVSFRLNAGLLEITLPSWAAPPVPAVAPPTTFVHGSFAPHEDRDRRAAMGGRG